VTKIKNKVKYIMEKKIVNKKCFSLSCNLFNFKNFPFISQKQPFLINRTSDSVPWLSSPDYIYITKKEV